MALYTGAVLTGLAFRGKLKRFEVMFPEERKTLSKLEKTRLQNDFRAFSQRLKEEKEKQNGGK